MKNKLLHHTGKHCRGGRHGRGHKFGRRGSRGRLFAGGEMRLALLDLLNDGPGHGYELMQRLSTRTDGRYEPSAGATYPVLQQILDEGLADVEATGGKKVYRLTDAGKALVEASADELNAIWERASTWRQWSGLDAPELADVSELRTLIRIVIEKLREIGDDADKRGNVRKILAGATEEVRKA